MDELYEGIYLQEDRNRFLCTVLVEGKEEKCYVPASCKLEKLISLSGEMVVLKPIKKADSNLRFSLYAVKKGKSWILLNLSEANTVLGEHLNKKCFDYLGNRKSQIYEKRIGNYKADIFLPESNTLVEVKTILTEKRQGIFPGIASKRTKEQLRTITALLEKGYRACFMIMSLNPRTKEIVIAEEMKATIEAACSKGMICRAYSIRFRNQKPVVGEEVRILI